MASAINKNTNANSNYADWELSNRSDGLGNNKSEGATYLNYIINYYHTNGTVPSKKEFNSMFGTSDSQEYLWAIESIYKNKDKAGFDPYTLESTITDYNTNAFNDYYNDAYGYDVAGTNANKQYNQIVQNAQSVAQQDSLLADAMAQQQAMNQAATVKNIVDQMRAERRAMLQSGYSQYDIANSEMTSLMNNINQLNNTADQMNQAKLQAQYNYNNAQATAYDQWLQQANAQATAGSAYAAADAGDVVTTAKRLRQNKGLDYYVKQAQGAHSGS